MGEASTREAETSDVVSAPAWAQRAAERSPAVQRSRERQIRQAEAIVDAARRLIPERGEEFTTVELVREAGVGLQTFYRLFPGKDQLLLTVFEQLIAESCVEYEAAAQHLSDPLARLRVYITEALRGLSLADDNPRFTSAVYWRLHQLFPDDMVRASQPFMDLVARELGAATDAGLVSGFDSRRDAWFVTKLVIAVFHHYAYVSVKPDATSIADELWSFCCRPLGGYVTSG